VKLVTNESKDDGDSECTSAQEDLSSGKTSPSRGLSKTNSENGKSCNSLCIGR
jgi:hypothetical protein